MKRIVSIILAFIMLLSFCACDVNHGNSTIEPTETQQPTLSPTQDPSEVSTADIEFAELDRELFVSTVTSDGLTFHQYVKNPESFGINEADIERGWGDFSYESYLDGLEENLSLKQELETIDYDSLSQYNKLAYDNLILLLEKTIDEGDTFYYNEPLKTLNGDHSMLPLMLTMYEINSKEDIDNYLVLLQDSDRYINQIIQFEIQKAERGLFMTENALDQVIETCQKYVDEGKKFFLIEFFEQLIKENDFSLSKEEKNDYIETNNSYITSTLLPTYSRLIDTLESLRGSCSDFVGASQRGDESLEYFKNSICSSGACFYDIDIIEQRLKSMCDETFAELMEIMQSDSKIVRYYYSDKTTSDTQDDIDYLKKVMQNKYPALAEQKIEFISVPKAVADDFSPAAYLISAYDDSSRNVILLNPSSDDSSILFTLAHECYPGHLYQTQYFRNLSGLTLTQQIFAPTGYTEGWAVMSENFIADYTDDFYAPACKAYQLESTLLNILIPAYCSLKINTDAWNEEQIMNYLEGFGVAQQSYYEIINEYAINMPDYFFNYALGYTCTKIIYDSRNCLTDEDNVEFFTEYLNYGPCYFNILFDKFEIDF